MQSDTVPVCSRDVEPSAKPPSPTQKAEYAELPALQVVAGCTQLPATAEKAVGVAAAPLSATA